MVVFAKPEFDRLKLLAEAAYPEEFCAILVGKREGSRTEVKRILPTPNVHEHPRRAYTISPGAVIVAQRKSREEELQILGFLHSHPDHSAEPSPTDLEQALWLGCVYGIVSVRGGKFADVGFYRLGGNDLQDRHFLPDDLHCV